MVSTLPAKEEENVLAVLFTVVMLEAREELFVLILLCSPSILTAILELVVVNVP